MLYRSPKHRARLAANRPRSTVNRAGKAVCAALLGTALSAISREAQGASWDPVPGVIGAGDGIINGGSGTWDVFAPNWTSDGGFTNVPWVNFDAASFAGNTGGLVTVANGGVTATSITFDATSDFSLYTIQSTGDVLTLAGAGQITTNQDATINSILAGSVGLTKQGAGTLTLGGLNNFSGPITIAGGRLRVNDAGNLGAASSLLISNGAAFEATNPLTFAGGVSIGSGGGTIALAGPAVAVTLSGVLSGGGPLLIDGSGGGSLLVNNPANFTGAGNTFTGNLFHLGGGSTTLAYRVIAPSGQVYFANAGTLNLGNSVPGATVALSAGSLVQAVGTGVVLLNGRATSPAVGVAIGGDLMAQSGGRIVVGDGLDDASQIFFTNSSHLTADAGTIVLKPRAQALTIDANSVGSLSVRNGGVLALAGNADLILNRDVDQSGPWTLANQSANTLRIVGGSQDSTEGLTLRGESGLMRYEVDAITLASSPANGSLNVELRGGTIDINNGGPGKQFNYSPGYVVSGWGQLGTSAANQTHVIPFGGATLYASGPAGATLSVMGGFNESFGSKAAFQIGDNDALMLSVPNAPASAYSVGSVLIDPQGAGSVARFVVGSGGAISANTSAFVNANNRVRFEVQGGATLTSDVSSTGSLLVNAPGSVPINVTGGGAFVTRASTFLLQPNETIGTAGTLFGFNGATVTNLTLNGVVDLNGSLGGSINGASTGTIKLDAGESLSLGAAADLLSMTLAYGGSSSAPALLEVNAPASTVRLGTGAALTVPSGIFNGTREFKVTAGTFQVDAADASSVNIGGVNQLSVDRTNNAVADPALVGTLTLNGGAFQIGTTASTTTVMPGGMLAGRGTLGHAGIIDTLVNNGTVRASGGPLTLLTQTIRGTGVFDPNGQVMPLTSGLTDFSGTSASILRVVSAGGGSVTLGVVSAHSGGTVIDGSAGAGPVTLKITAAGALGSGPVTLNGGVLVINSDSSLNFRTNPISVIGSAASGINFDHISQNASRTQLIGALTLGGQTLNITGPPTTNYTYTLDIGGTTITAAGATLLSTGGAPIRTGALTVNGPLNLAMSTASFTIDALSGGGAITRSSSSGTLIFSKAASGFTGSFFSSVGTTNFTAPTAMGTGTYTFAGGNFNINAGAAGALSGASGTMQAGNLSLNTANALDGTALNFIGGNLFAGTPLSLGTGTIQLNGGKMFLRSDVGSVFNGTINVTGISGTNNLGSLTVDRSSAAGTGGTHTIAALSVSNQTLNVIAGNTGYGLAVAGATTIGGGSGGTININAAQLTTGSLVLSSSLNLTGGGNATIGPIGGNGFFNLSTSGMVTLTSAPQAGFASSVQLNTGTLNMNNAASLAGGSVTVNGGILNLGLANALSNTQAVLASGFLNANAPNALNGVTMPVINGTLFANANNALGSSSINMTGGNLTATTPGALGSANISLAGAILALRSDTAASFGGSVTLTGTGFSTVSVAKRTDLGGTGNNLSINSLALGGQTLNVTGADNDCFTVINPIAMTGTDPTTINTTAADARFQGALTGAGALVKNGVRSLTLDGGGSFGATTVNSGTLVVNNAWNTPGVIVGGVNGPATLQMGGAGVNSPGNLTINAGTLRIAKGAVTDAVPLASVINVGSNGDVKVEYAGLTSSTLANNINVDTSVGARTLTLSAAGGVSAAQVSTFTLGGLIVKSGANALNIVAQADTALDDGFNNLVRPPSRLVLSGSQTYTTDLVHNGGIVIGKGTIPAGTTANPFGVSTNALSMNVTDSTIGGMVADGQSSALFSKVVTTPAAVVSPRKRLGAFFNPAGLAGTQTINFNGSFTWNDGSFPFYLITPPGNVSGAAAMSPWNGIFVDPGAMLQMNSGAVLDNILTSTITSVTSSAPIYIGGGGAVRFTTGISRNLSQAKGLAGTATVLDNTIFQSNTTGQHFDGVELRTGTYQVGATSAQALAGGFAVNPSLFDPTRTTSNLITDVDLGLNGIGAAQAFRIGAGQTLMKSGAGALNVNGDQLHGVGAAVQVNQGTVNFNTDGGMNNGSPAVNNLSINVNNGATINLASTQHLAQLTVAGGLAKLTASGAKVLEATSVSAAGGKLDLTSNRLIVDYAPGNSPMASIRQQIISGYNAGGALWGGNGIVSSSAALNPTSVGLGYAEASEVLLNGATYGGESVDGSAVLVQYTLLGDATLDGVVDFNDLVKLAQNYNTTVSASTQSWWNHGDFTYDGVVDFNDLVKLAQNYNTSLPGAAVPGAPASFSQDLAAAFAQAPEPGTLGALGIVGAIGLMRRRTRRGR